MFNFNQNGQIALLVTLVILTVILSIGAGLTLVTIREMEMAKKIEESAKALSAADAGMEYALYRVDQDLIIDRLCSNGWTLLDNSSEYCLEIVGGTAIKSIGKFGTVRRAILSNDEAVIVNPDQYCNYSHSGDNVCAGGECGVLLGTCTGVGGVGDLLSLGFFPSNMVGQTFRVDTDGYLYQISVWSSSCTCLGDCFAGNPCCYWQMELRDVEQVGVDESIRNDHPGDNVLAESNIIDTPSCIQLGGFCQQVDFVFSTPHLVNKGQRYSFVVKLTDMWGNSQGPTWEHRTRLKTAADGPYYPGRAWYTDGGDTWRDDCTVIVHDDCPDSGSDLMFEVFIDPDTSSAGVLFRDFEETRP
ncbi:pilus assembly PilX N-terminal domain-containing protein [Candidatus Parcubacteria bacterium]|nr:pilus assembly PilX N-terminal domain-containing protein [Candidatus Parcubacteria bacterium]